MSNCLKLNNADTKSELQKLSKKVFLSNNIAYKMQSNINYNCAKTLYDEDTGLANKVSIGVGGLKEKNGLFTKCYVSDQKFAQVVINIYHEYTHCQQKNEMFQKSNPTQDEINQAMCDLACRDNKHYYMDNGNYFKNPNEIQAEYYGVTKAYDYLCNTFSDIDPKQHEKTILDIVNEKSENCSYWISHEKDKPFTSLSEVEDAFEKAYDDAFEAKRVYFVSGSRSDGDAAKAYMDSDSRARTAYLDKKTGAEQDKIMAVINCKLRPELKEQYSSLENTDLSYEANIGKTKQSRINYADRAASLLGNIDASNKQDDMQYF